CLGMQKATGYCTFIFRGRVQGSSYSESADSLASTVIDRVWIPTGFTDCTL
ncbi:hypothetical protein KI387_039342, partial [Taxus chinensis]